MKQLEMVAIGWDGGAATLTEHAGDFLPDAQRPRLVVMNSQETIDGQTSPASSAVIWGDPVRQLYELLHQYYSTERRKPHGRSWGKPSMAGGSGATVRYAATPPRKLQTEIKKLKAERDTLMRIAQTLRTALCDLAGKED